LPLTRTRAVPLVSAVLAVAALAPSAQAAGPPARAADLDCSDFGSQASAQDYFLSRGGPSSDPDRLDGDGDGIACESNPCPCNHSTTPTTPTQPTPPPPPPPADSDGDGVPDSIDACPFEANATVDGCAEAEPPSDQANDDRARRLSAVSFLRRYYRRVSNGQFATGWEMLARPVRLKLGPFHRWKAGHRRTLGVSVLEASARLSGGRAVVSIRLRSRDRDACSGRVVRQYFRGRWLLASRDDSWAAVAVRIRKTSGGRVHLSKSDCPPPPPPPPDCQGYSPCIPPGPDVDCAGGSGDGPRYVNGPVYVEGSDPYGLDSDGDGVGCEDSSLVTTRSFGRLCPPSGSPPATFPAGPRRCHCAAPS
jgi:Excalibur calcium-binding domain